MPLKKYYDEVAGLPNRIDEQNKRSEEKTVTEIVDITSDAMDFQLTMNSDKWVVKEVALSFSSATPRNFTIAKKSIANIVQHRNDRFWLRSEDKVTTRVTVDPGVYDAAGLAAEIKSKLDDAFSDIGTSFVVTYASNKFTFDTTTSRDIQYYPINNRTGVRKNSTLGPVIGMTAETLLANTFFSDTNVDLDTSYTIIGASGNVATSYVLTDELTMDSSSALSITTNTAGVTVTAKITYESR